MRVAAHDLQNTSKERAFLALISPRVVNAPLSDFRARFIEPEISLELTNCPYGPRVHSAVTAMRYCLPMRSDDYRRLHAVCLDMGKQSTEPDIQARWLAAADAWLKLATERRRPGRTLKTQAVLPNTSTSVG